MKDRILSSIVMILICVPIFILGGNWFLLFSLLLASLCYKELTKLESDTPVICNIMGLLSLILFICANNDGLYLMGIPYFPILFTTISLLLPTIISKYNKNYSTKDAFTLIGEIVLLGLAFNAFNLLMQTNKMILLYIIVITMLSDVFAYLIGSKFGKTHFTKISPNKTIEGSIAGFIAGTIGGVIFYLVFVNNNMNIIGLIILTMLLSLAGMYGDLLFSKIKRENNIKDFSKIIPGHGGVLDRLDSLIITSIFYLLIMRML